MYDMALEITKVMNFFLFLTILLIFALPRDSFVSSGNYFGLERIGGHFGSNLFHSKRLLIGTSYVRDMDSYAAHEC